MATLEDASTPEYAILNDLAHAYSLLHYHIAIPDQVRQLEALGFGNTVAYNMSGTAVREDTRDSTTYFLTRKAEAGSSGQARQRRTTNAT